MFQKSVTGKDQGGEEYCLQIFPYQVTLNNNKKPNTNEQTTTKTQTNPNKNNNTKEKKKMERRREEETASPFPKQEADTWEKTACSTTYLALTI